MFYLTQCTYSIIAISNQLKTYQYTLQGFPGGLMVKKPLCNARDTSSIPDPGRSHMPRSKWAHAPQLLSLCSKAQELSTSPVFPSLHKFFT